MKFTVPSILLTLFMLPAALVAGAETTSSAGAVVLSAPWSSGAINSIKNSNKMIAFHREKAAFQETHRDLQSDSELKQICEAILAIFFTPESGCKCVKTADGSDYEANCDELFENCQSCENLQGQEEETCLKIDTVAAAAFQDTDTTETTCWTYTSGVFDNTICETRGGGAGEFGNDACTIAIDGTECNSCTVVFCDVDNAFGYNVDFDCTNVLAGEMYSLCTDNVPETSRFIFKANNPLYPFTECLEGLVGGGGGDGDGGRSSGTTRLMYAFTLVGLFAIAVLF